MHRGTPCLWGGLQRILGCRQQGSDVSSGLPGCEPLTYQLTSVASLSLQELLWPSLPMSQI